GRSAISQRAAVQPGAARTGDTAQLSRRRAAWVRALSRGCALRRGHARAARTSAARPQLRVGRSTRSRDLRVSRPTSPLGIDRAVARPRSAWTQAGLRHAARAGDELFRSIYRLYRADYGVRRGEPCGGDGRLRLEARGHECVESRADAPRLSAP